MSHFPTCVMHRILVIRTIQGDQNVRRLHRDADLKMAGEREKKTIPWHRTLPCTNGALRPQTLQMFSTASTPQTTKPISRCPRLPHDRINEKATKNKNPGAEPAARSVHAAAAPVEVTCPGCGFARAPSPARPGHQPPPAPAGTKPSHMRQQNASVVCA